MKKVETEYNGSGLRLYRAVLVSEKEARYRKGLHRVTALESDMQTMLGTIKQLQVAIQQTNCDHACDHTFEVKAGYACYYAEETCQLCGETWRYERGEEEAEAKLAHYQSRAKATEEHLAKLEAAKETTK